MIYIVEARFANVESIGPHQDKLESLWRRIRSESMINDLITRRRGAVVEPLIVILA